MHIGCVTSYELYNQNVFGGHTFYMCKSLENRVSNFEYIAPLEIPWRLLPVITIKEKLYRKILKKKYYATRDRRLIKHYAQQIEKRLKKTCPDIIFSPTTDGSQPIAYLNCKQPIVIWTDTTIASVIDWYPAFKSNVLCSETLRDAIENERSAVERSSLLVFKTDWAANKAIDFYNINPEKVKVNSGGPSFPVKRDHTYSEIESIIDLRSKERCKLLFIGMSWKNKGGDKVLEILDILNKNGLRTELNIVGREPPLKKESIKHANIYGYINKSLPDESKKLMQLIRQSHFLIIPTNFDAGGISLIEANMFGVPSISTNVGGISTIIKDGINGMKFSVDSRAEEYAEYIQKMFSDYKSYKELAKSSFNEYKKRLNWNIASKKVLGYMKELI